MFQCNENVEMNKFLCSLACTWMTIIESQFYIIDIFKSLNVSLEWNAKLVVAWLNVVKVSGLQMVIYGSALRSIVMYRLYNVLCWLWNIYEGAELPSVYFIPNTKHCITYLALSRAPECIFHNKHKTLYNLFSPVPAVSCVVDTQV